ncbi:MAG: lytic transglycosylase domain-containing protein [Pseudobdellovibrionaceae bacterium]
MKQMKAILVLILTALLYQNFAFPGLGASQVKEVDEKIRLEHAKELLGKYYGKSSVAETEGLPAMNIHLFNHVRSNLPADYKKKASRITEALVEESHKYNFDPVFVMALIRTESNFNPLALGSVGEIGLMQIRPETAEWMAKRAKIKWKGEKTLKDPIQNIRIGVAYMAYLRDHFDNKAYKYLSAYNVGPGKLKKMFENANRPKIYSTKVMKYYEQFYGEIAIYADLNHLAANPQVF